VAPRTAWEAWAPVRCTPGQSPPPCGRLPPPPPPPSGAGPEKEDLGTLPADIEVKVIKGDHAGRNGKITQMRAGGERYAVVLTGGDSVVIEELARHEIEAVTPGKKDSIIIINGDLMNSTGTLIGVDGTDGIVKMDTTNDIKIVELRSCAKLVRS